MTFKEENTFQGTTFSSTLWASGDVKNRNFTRQAQKHTPNQKEQPYARLLRASIHEAGFQGPSARQLFNFGLREELLVHLTLDDLGVTRVMRNWRIVRPANCSFSLWRTAQPCRPGVWTSLSTELTKPANTTIPSSLQPSLFRPPKSFDDQLPTTWPWCRAAATDSCATCCSASSAPLAPGMAKLPQGIIPTKPAASSTPRVICCILQKGGVFEDSNRRSWRVPGNEARRWFWGCGAKTVNSWTWILFPFLL